MKRKSILLFILLASVKISTAQFVFNDQTITNNPTYFDWIKDVSAEANGTNDVCGRFNGAMTFGGLSVNSFGGAGDDDYFIARMNANGTCAWIQRIGNTSNQTGVIQIYYYGSAIYVSGSFTGTINVGGTNITSSTLKNFIAKYNVSGGLQWVSVLTTLPASSEINGLAVNSNGIFVTFMDGISNGGVAKVDFTSHAVTWNAALTMTVTGTGISQAYNWPYDITVDASSAIYICGAFKVRQTIAGGGTNTALYKNASGTTGGTFTLSLNGAAGSESDMFLAKYNTSGALQWVKRYGNTHDNYGCSGIGDEATGVSYNLNQNCVYLTGHFNGYIGNPANMGAGINLLPYNAGTTATTDIFLSKITTGGVTTWAKQLGGEVCETGGSVTSDNTGNAYLTGRYESKFSGPCYSTTNTLHNSGTVITKFSSAGILQWLTNIEVLYNYYTLANGGNFNITCDNAGYAYVIQNAFSTNILPAGGNNISANGTDALYSKVKVTPGADAGPDAIICCGAVQIGSPSWDVPIPWTPTAGLSNPNISNPTTTKTGTYTVTVNCGGCITTDQVIVTKASSSCCRLGQNEDEITETGNKYNIYPNPSSANSTFFVELKSTDVNVERKLSIYSVDGSLIMQRVLRGNETEEIKHNLTAGIYLVLIQSPEEVKTLRMTVVE